MSVFEKLRLYHAALAILALAAYATGEAGLIHAWLGYGVAVIIFFRIVWGLFGPRQLGIARFLPKLSDARNLHQLDPPIIGRILILGIVANLLVVTGTGIAMDRFKLLPVPSSTIASAGATPIPQQSSAVILAAAEEREDEEEGENEGWLEELHEASANLLLLFVGMHVTYLLLFKRRLAAFMLFRSTPSDKTA